MGQEIPTAVSPQTIQDIEKGLFDEFNEPEVVEQPQNATTGQQTGTIVKEIDLGDGPVKFEGADYDDIIRQVAEYKNRREEEAMLAPPQDIEEPVQLRQTQITADELAALHLKFQEDPLTWFAGMMEAVTGYSADSLVEALDASTKVEAAMYGESVGTDFVNRHTHDYYPCPENGDKMARFLQSQQLAPSPQNYDYAFNQLNRVKALKPFPEEETPKKPVRVSTGLSAGDYPTRTGGPVDNEAAIRDFAKLSPDQMEQVIRENAARSRR